MLIFITCLLVIDVALHVFDLYKRYPIKRVLKPTIKKIIPYLQCQFCHKELPDVIKLPDGRIACTQCRVRVLNSI